MHSRNYSYDAQNYSGGQVPPNQEGTHYTSSTHSYHRGYNHQPGQYYGQSDGAQSNPYFRSMTPMVHPSQRYASGGGDDRFYQAPGDASSSQTNPPAYPSQTTYYSSQYTNGREHRTRPPGGHSHPPDSPFIPTPSEISHSYNNYPPRQISVPPHSSAIPQDVPYPGSQYPAPHTIVPSSRSSSQRPTRISTSGRPQTAPTGQSPTSTSSPSGERFPCDRCGKTFSRSHDRKRHHETQHLSTPVIHRCRYCEKEFSRADSLKRHLDNGCDEMPT